MSAQGGGRQGKRGIEGGKGARRRGREGRMEGGSEERETECRQQHRSLNVLAVHNLLNRVRSPDIISYLLSTDVELTPHHTPHTTHTTHHAHEPQPCVACDEGTGADGRDRSGVESIVTGARHELVDVVGCDGAAVLDTHLLCVIAVL